MIPDDLMQERRGRRNLGYYKEQSRRGRRSYR
jgi:hypothetical protein